MPTPDDSQLAHGFGRVEAKLDRIDDKIDRHAELLAAHGVRLDRVETDVTDIRRDLSADTTRMSVGRQMIWVAVVGALASGVVAALVQLLPHH